MSTPQQSNDEQDFDKLFKTLPTAPPKSKDLNQRFDNLRGIGHINSAPSRHELQRKLDNLNGVQSSTSTENNPKQTDFSSDNSGFFAMNSADDLLRSLQHKLPTNDTHTSINQHNLTSNMNQNDNFNHPNDLYYCEDDDGEFDDNNQDDYDQLDDIGNQISKLKQKQHKLVNNNNIKLNNTIQHPYPPKTQKKSSSKPKLDSFNMKECEDVINQAYNATLPKQCQKLSNTSPYTQIASKDDDIFDELDDINNTTPTINEFDIVGHDLTPYSAQTPHVASHKPQFSPQPQFSESDDDEDDISRMVRQAKDLAILEQSTQQAKDAIIQREEALKEDARALEAARIKTAREREAKMVEIQRQKELSLLRQQLLLNPGAIQPQMPVDTNLTDEELKLVHYYQQLDPTQETRSTSQYSVNINENVNIDDEFDEMFQ